MAYYNALPEANSNHVAPNLRAILLRSQLFGRSCGLCSAITVAQLVLEQEVSLIFAAVYKRNALSVVSEAYKTLNSLRRERNSGESMKNFESRFSTQVAKFKSISNTT